MKVFLRGSVNLLPSAMRLWVKHIPLLAGTQRWLVNNVLSNEPFVHTINAGPARGLHFQVTLPRDKAIWSGTFELAFSTALQQGVCRGDVCYDVGGYRGYMTSVMALAGASRVVTFEPLPENIAALNQLITLNPMLPVQVERVAVGNTDGVVEFKIMPDQSMGKLAFSEFQEKVESVGEISVAIVRLDTLVFERSFPPPSVIKIDVEGAELDVLAGASRVLGEYCPRIYLEAHSEALSEKCTRLLETHGYCVTQLESGPMQAEQTRHLIASPISS